MLNDTHKKPLSRREFCDDEELFSSDDSVKGPNYANDSSSDESLSSSYSNSSDDDNEAADKRRKHFNHKEVSKNIKDGVRSHTSLILTIKSQYTQAHSEKLCIDGRTTIAQLHCDFKEECENQEKPFANLTMCRTFLTTSSI
ncbi:unnamed protein product [Psylliodes chrysocephalus]|uniref:Uncharacterized protein n=1 Tax=Psylliodes chrysocephalus TaxID=3402493 RepID=A0A9P0D1B7_9CUCU|nr:unnamed protein product [Psylliodes chrysocephala]